ncbi:hypothetical protein L208DRAFT_1064536, partial [Tricholoma matsutake]
MNMVNASTQVSPFVLKTGQSPCVLLPIGLTPNAEECMEEEETAQARELIERINNEVEGAKDCLLGTLTVHHANKEHSKEPEFRVGEKVMMKTMHRRREYIQKKSGRVAK